MIFSGSVMKYEKWTIDLMLDVALQSVAKIQEKKARHRIEVKLRSTRISKRHKNKTRKKPPPRQRQRRQQTQGNRSLRRK